MLGRERTGLSECLGLLTDHAKLVGQVETGEEHFRQREWVVQRPEAEVALASLGNSDEASVVRVE